MNQSASKGLQEFDKFLSGLKSQRSGHNESFAKNSPAEQPTAVFDMIRSPSVSEVAPPVREPPKMDFIKVLSTGDDFPRVFESQMPSIPSSARSLGS